jgi:cytochrome c oxidase subunit 1
VWGSVPVAVALIGWFWPTRAQNRRAVQLEQRP